MSTFAIVETGSKQYRVEPKSVIEVEKLPLPKEGKEITLDRVLLVQDGGKLHVGDPLVKGAKVLCEHLGPLRAQKVISFKFRRRKSSQRKLGHRQALTRLLVKKIQTAA